MKKLSILLSSVIVIVMMSCNMGVKKDLLSGLKVTNNGLTYQEAYVSVAGVKTTTTEFAMNTDIDFIATGVKGFVETDSVAFIGASISVFDKDNKEVMNYPDLFSSYDETGVSPIDAEEVTLTLTIGSPLVAGETYTWKSKIWDKKGTGVINSEMTFKVK